MNLFELAVSKKAEADSKKRAGKTVLATTIAVPHFKGVYRRGTEYKVKLHANKKVVEREVKPLSGAFIITYFTCLAACIVQAENKAIEDNNKGKAAKDKSPLYTLSTYLVEVLINSEGFMPDEYSQGKIAGAKRIEMHLKTIAKERDLKVNIDAEGNISIDKKVINDVLSAI